MMIVPSDVEVMLSGKRFLLGIEMTSGFAAYNKPAATRKIAALRWSDVLRNCLVIFMSHMMTETRSNRNLLFVIRNGALHWCILREIRTSLSSKGAQ